MGKCTYPPTIWRTELTVHYKFTRVWIIQEYIFSSKAVFISGKHRFAAKDLERIQSVLGSCWDRGGAISHKRLQFPGQQTFLALREELPRINKLKFHLRSRKFGGFLGTTQATDPRDLVYAMINFSRWEPHLPNVDYKASVAQVFSSVARYCIKATGVSPY
jgi:hypothetical protein